MAPAAEVDLARTGRAFTASSLGQTRVWVPVRLANGGVTIGVVSIPSSSRYTGVLQAWAVLAAVGALVLVLSVILVDRMARSMVVAIEELGTVTRRLQQGDLAARVRPAGPTEVSLAGRAVNELAERIGQLLATERESAADLSHRLRTPLTALHLAADGLRCTEDVSADRAAA